MRPSNTADPKTMARVAALVVCCAATLSASHDVCAQPAADDVAAASALYEEGQRAHRAGDHELAARAFAKADELAPDVSALEAALVSVLESDDAALAMDLAGRVDREVFHAELMKLAERARAHFGSKAGRIVVHCDDCRVTIDGGAARRGVATWLAVGSHAIVIHVDGREERRTVIVEPASIVTILPLDPRAPPPSAPISAPPSPPPSAPPLAPARADRGPSPIYFWIGLGLSAGASAGAIASSVDTDAQFDAFVAAPTEEAASAGEDAELRTHVLWGVSAGLWAVTAALGIFVVDWSDADASAWHPAGDGLRLRF